MRIGIAIGLVIGSITGAIAQYNVQGSVTDSHGEAIPYANIMIKETKKGTASSDMGHYTIPVAHTGTVHIIATAIGYAPYKAKVMVDGNLAAHNIVLQNTSLELDQVVVTGTMKEVYIKDSPVKVEVISAAFLKTNPTNNVIEAIQTVNGVQEQVNCGVCATNDIHINGLEGPYTLVLIDGMPIMSALASVYGFNGIPTSLVERIEIVKGPSSTLYGTEAVGGVINVITKRPEKMPLVSFNSFYTSHRELNADLAISPKISDKLQTTLSGNFYRNQYRMDLNHDNFTDIPLTERLSLFNRWSLKRKGNRVAELAVRYYNENRFGGVMEWEEQHIGDDQVYGEYIETERIEVIGTYQLPLAETIKIDYSFNFHDQDSYYGVTRYKAKQAVFFSNFIWNKAFGNHDLLTGITLRQDQYKDNSLAQIEEVQFIPGVFVQDEWKVTNRTSLLTGMRIDHHKSHGYIFSPRLNVKHELSTATALRLNVGTGFRRVNLFTEDHAALTGARTVQIASDLLPEQSLNANVNLNHVFVMGASTGTLDVDGFYTYFQNKIIPDYDTDPSLIIYDNLAGHGITRGFAVNYNQSFAFPLSISVGGTFQNVFEVNKDENGRSQKEQQVFAPKFSGTFVIGYKLDNVNLSIDYTGRVMGPQHLPTFPAHLAKPTQSPWYIIQNLQLTKTFENTSFECYGGVKNLGNWTQDSPLIAPDRPFSDEFDTSYAWGPLQERRFYIGLRWSLEK